MRVLCWECSKLVALLKNDTCFLATSGHKLFRLFRSRCFRLDLSTALPHPPLIVTCVLEPRCYTVPSQLMSTAPSRWQKTSGCFLGLSDKTFLCWWCRLLTETLTMKSLLLRFVPRWRCVQVPCPLQGLRRWLRLQGSGAFGTTGLVCVCECVEVDTCFDTPYYDSVTSIYTVCCFQLR